MSQLQQLLDELHLETLKELVARLRRGDATSSDLSTAISYLRATKRPEQMGATSSEDEVKKAMETLQKGRETAKRNRERRANGEGNGQD